MESSLRLARPLRVRLAGSYALRTLPAASGSVSIASASEARWSTRACVMGTRASTFFFRAPRFLAMNVFTWPSAAPSSFSAALRFFLSSARNEVTESSCCSAVRTSLSFSLSMVVKDWR